MLKRAMVAGLQAAGITVVDLRFAAPGLVRHEIKTSRLAGGFHVRRAADASDMVEIVFFEPPGVLAGRVLRADIEKHLSRSEFRRVTQGQVGGIVEAPRAIESYSNALGALVDPDRVRARGFRLVADYGFSAAAPVAEALFAELGVESIGVNAGGDPGEARVVTFEEAVGHVGRLIGAVEADLGVLFDSHAERVWLVDDTGTLIPAEQTLLLLLRLIASSGATGAAAVPVTVSTRWPTRCVARA
jgi:phosphomannomutase